MPANKDKSEDSSKSTTHSVTKDTASATQFGFPTGIPPKRSIKRTISMHNEKDMLAAFAAPALRSPSPSPAIFSRTRSCHNKDQIMAAAQKRISDAVAENKRKKETVAKSRLSEQKNIDNLLFLSAISSVEYKNWVASLKQQHENESFKAINIINKELSELIMLNSLSGSKSSKDDLTITNFLESFSHSLKHKETNPEKYNNFLSKKAWLQDFLNKYRPSFVTLAKNFENYIIETAKQANNRATP
jgi:hypothetical protein